MDECVRLELREWDMDFAVGIAAVANDPEVSAKLRDAFPFPYTVEAARAFIKYVLEHPDREPLNRVILVNGIPAGGISVTPGSDIFRRSGEIGYWLGQKYWGQGIATAAVKVICREAFAGLELERIYATVFEGNEASTRVLEKNGFQLEGILRRAAYKRGRVLDCRLYGLLKAD